MILDVLGSGSSGNCYILQNDKEALILEAGMPIKDVSKAMKGRTDKVNACLITHEHKDHSGRVKEYLDHGIRVYTTHGTCEAIRPWAESKCGQPMDIRSKMMKLGGFLVIPFNTVHDAAEPCGYYIHHDDIGNLLFATDTKFIPNRFKHINHIMIECNYDDCLLEKRDIPQSLKERIRESHMSIDTCIEALNANDLRNVCDIMLIHISDNDGSKEEFKRRVQDATGVFNVMVAESGSRYEISVDPF